PREVPSFHQSAPAPAASAQGVRRKFINFRVGDSPESNRVNALLFDAHDNLWIATDGGLYRAAAVSSRDLQFKLVVPHLPTAIDMAAFADSRGRLWFAMHDELIQVVGDRIIKYGPQDGVVRPVVVSVVEDRQGRLLVANEHQVFEFIASASAQDRGRWRPLPLTLAPDQRVAAMVVDATGTLWVGTWNGLIKYRDGKQTLYTDAQGLSGNHILALAEDRDGNLWVGTEGRGVCKLSGELIVSFTRTEGLPNLHVLGVIEDRRGRIYASVINGGVVEIVEGGAAPVPGSQASRFANIFPLQDSRGDWWIYTAAEGLFRFDGPELQLRRGGKISSVDGIPAGKASGCWPFAKDQSGKLWMVCGAGIYLLDRAQNGRAVFERIPIPPLRGVPIATSDNGGALWIGGNDSLACFMKGKTTVLQPAEGLPEMNPRSLFRDSRSWLWIGLRYKGVSVTKNPSAENLKFVNYSTEQGLASDTVWSITEDDAVRIYLSTGKGLDQLDPMTGRIRHFNTKDGLASDAVGHCLRDRNGNIWVATS
ncbi:MAG TPA: two-component regulator propeller domain-containing protein, partial [Blastocatellia bacterium]|nr:two-component regulator propeller domain-containing protein [Blastocatellia bacterium]